MKICLQIPSMKTLFETTAEIMGEDFFELMGEVEPAKDVENYHDLEAMVREVNETQVAPEERLSDNNPIIIFPLCTESHRKLTSNSRQKI